MGRHTLEGFKDPVYVTRPFMPPFEAFSKGMEKIWDNRWLTNQGPMLQNFERELSGFFGTENLSLFTNGTLALQIGLRGLGISGEVITTPFTFIATTHALHLNGIEPVFCDIAPGTYTIDPQKIPALITPRTSAILAVHVFGLPCDTQALERIGAQYDIKIIYDAAHAFGTRLNGRDISGFGDLSMFSFHATKLFHSIEGGAIVFKDGRLKQGFDRLGNFGLSCETEAVTHGMNAKMNEFQALMGCQVLPYVDKIISKRKAIDALYSRRLSGIPGLYIPQKSHAGVAPNYAYFPIEVDETVFGMSRDELYRRLKDYNVFTRKYFFPVIPDFACYKDHESRADIPCARSVASRILTLPIYEDIGDDVVNRICDLIEMIRHAHGKPVDGPYSDPG